MAGGKEGEKKGVDISWGTRYSEIKKGLKAAFGDDSLHPDLYWTLDLATSYIKGRLCRAMTPSLGKPRAGTDTFWVPDEQFQAWLYSEQERILSKEKSVLQLRIAKLEAFIKATIEQEGKHERDQVGNKVDREAARQTLEKLWARKDQYEGRRDQHALNVLKELDKRIAEQRAVIAGIDLATTDPDPFAPDNGDAIMKLWWENADDFGDPKKQKMINIVRARKNAEVERNTINTTEIPVIDGKLSATTAAKEYWIAYARDVQQSYSDDD